MRAHRVRRASRPCGRGRRGRSPGGFARLRELERLVQKERPELVATVAWAAGNGDRSENGDYIYGKKRLREIDRRIRFLIKRLDAAEVVDPAAPRDEDADQVFFGATVTYATNAGEEHTISIVGIDEIGHGARLHELDLADGARAHQGARRRHRDAAHARRRRGDRDPRVRYEPLATGPERPS